MLSGNGPRAAVRELCTQFERATGHKIDLRFGVNPEVKKKIEAGETFDVVVGNPPIIDALIKDGMVVASARRYRPRRSRRGGAQRRAQARHLDRSTAFKQALLARKAVAFPGKGASGIYFVSLLDRMGIKAEMQSKLKPMAAEDTVEVVARGEADMVVVVATRIVDVPGVDVVGPIPRGVANQNRLCRRLERAAKEPEAAKALIAFPQRAGGGRHAQGQGRRAGELIMPLSPVLPPAGH